MGGGGGPVVKNKNVDRLKTRPPTRKQGERARSWGGREAQLACCCWARAGTQAGSEWVGGRFLCLKYCTTCWGSSASTALAKVSFAACRAEGEVERGDRKGQWKTGVRGTVSGLLLEKVSLEDRIRAEGQGCLELASLVPARGLKPPC